MSTGDTGQGHPAKGIRAPATPEVTLVAGIPAATRAGPPAGVTPADIQERSSIGSMRAERHRGTQASPSPRW